jgi:hypothetical protein
MSLYGSSSQVFAALTTLATFKHRHTRSLLGQALQNITIYAEALSTSARNRKVDYVR